MTETNRKHLRNFTTGLLGIDDGNKAYQRAVRGEAFVQGLVTDAKVLIVVKSMIVPAGNIAANTVQLMNRGVPFGTILRSYRKYVVELNAYVRNRDQEIGLKVDLATSMDPAAQRSIRNRLSRLQDANRRLAIWPLIEAGHFTAITDGNVTQEDLALANGEWTNHVEKLAQRIPDNGLRTAYRYATLNRDTALFQATAKAVQYGDFLAKAVLYDHQKAKGILDETAHDTVRKAFVDYNQLSGRGRQYLESIGLLWFQNFKLRATREAFILMRDNPVRSLLLGLGTPYLPIVGNPGMPQLDSLGGQLIDGSFWRSLGPEMGLNAFTLSPMGRVTGL